MRKSVLDLLWEQEQARPDQTALADESGAVTYREYAEHVRAIARFLIKNVSHGTRKQPVAVLIDRNLRSIEAFLGVACSGNFYVPLDPSLPAYRLQTIMGELKPVAVLDATDGGHACEIPAVPVAEILGGHACEIPAVPAAEVLDGHACEIPAVPVAEIIGGHAVMPEDCEAAQDTSDLRQVLEGIIDTDPLYAIFTSGSTGVPKGVLIAHRSVLDLVQSFEEAFAFPAGNVFGNQAPFDFDVSVKDIYNALYCGGTVQVIPKRMFVMPKLLIPYLAERGIQTIIWAVSAVRIVADFKALNEVETGQPLQIRDVMFSGEVMPVKALNYWMDNLPGARYVNLYGPTEITCNCTYYVVDRRFEPGDALPIGRTLPNMRICLMDEQQHRIHEQGKIGEICVEGTGLALGYYNNPEKTKESFILDPETPGYQNVVYRTGDLGYYDETGALMFANRSDSQIKHMGHRIELGEVEAALNAIDFVTIACCIYDAEREKIICVFQSETGDKKQIVGELAKMLPKYMWPNRYLKYDQIPMNSHGKIDRALLKQELLKK
ncbi:MAG: amino acid adenylation domain-containing protein [Eubacterium sp.]|nr:amino acid adenylation domain-containing protein [Eubacterium sp.]